jgi:hypothetical protein
MFGCAEIGDVPSWCEFAKRTRELDAPKSHNKTPQETCGVIFF